MSMEYIRMYYKVPAKRGQKVVTNGAPGIITGSRGAYLKNTSGRSEKILSIPPHPGNTVHVIHSPLTCTSIVF